MSPRRRRARLGVLAVAVPAVASCSRGFRFGAPDPVSEQGKEVLGLWNGFHWVGLVVGLLIWGLVLYSVLRFRRRNDELPSQSPYNVPVEIAYTIAPLLVVVALFAYTVVGQQKVTALADDPDVVIDVVGFQWSWQFSYPDEDVTVESDGTTFPRIVVPVDSTVRFRLETTDVVHSFWVPEFMVKRDLIPGIDNEIDVDVVQPGEWTGRCAEYCGLHHYRMNFTVAAVPAGEYRAWLDEQRSASEDRR